MTPETTEGASARSRVLEPRWRWAHVAALALILVVGFVAVDPTESFSADEGAVIVQVRTLSSSGWTMDHPVPEVDPEGAWFPLESSTRTSEGFAPYSKHPLYPMVLRPFEAMAGTPGMVALSTAATLALAVVGAVTSERLAKGTWVPALWILGVGSPALFNGYLVIAHTLGAALCASAALLVLVALDRTPRHAAWPLVGAATSLVVATLVRSEAVLMGGALAVAVLVAASGPRRTRWIAACVLVAASGVAYVVDGRLSQAVLGEAGVDPFTITNSGSFVAGRLEALSITWLQPTLESDVGIGAALLLAVMAGWLIVGWSLRRSDTDENLLVVLGWALGLIAVVRVAVDPRIIVPGLLVAFPLLSAGLLVARLRGRGPGQVLAVAFLAYSLAVLATQYSSGGSSQWGGRYFIAGLGLAVPVGLLAWSERRGSLGPRARRALAAGAVLTCGAMAVGAIVALGDIHARSAETIAFVGEEAIDASAGDPVVIATRAAIPRLSYDDLDRARWLLVDPDEVGTALERLADVGVEHVSIVDDTGELDDDTGRYDTAGTASRGQLVVERLVLRP